MGITSVGTISQTCNPHGDALLRPSTQLPPSRTWDVLNILTASHYLQIASYADSLYSQRGRAGYAGCRVVSAGLLCLASDRITMRLPKRDSCRAVHGETAMATEWYFRAQGKEWGPVSGSKLRSLAQNSQIGADTYVRKGADGDWVPAKRVKGLFEPVQQRSQREGKPPGEPVAASPSVAASEDPIAAVARCPKCSHPRENAIPGSTIECMHCGHSFTVPGVPDRPTCSWCGKSLASATSRCAECGRDPAAVTKISRTANGETAGLASSTGSASGQTDAAPRLEYIITPLDALAHKLERGAPNPAFRGRLGPLIISFEQIVQATSIIGARRVRSFSETFLRYLIDVRLLPLTIIIAAGALLARPFVGDDLSPVFFASVATLLSSKVAFQEWARLCLIDGVTGCRERIGSSAGHKKIWRKRLNESQRIERLKQGILFWTSAKHLQVWLTILAGVHISKYNVSLAVLAALCFGVWVVWAKINQVWSSARAPDGRPYLGPTDLGPNYVPVAKAAFGFSVSIGIWIVTVFVISRIPASP